MKDSLKSKLVFALFAIGIPLMLLGQAVIIKKTSDYPNNPSPAAGDLFLIARTGVTNFNIRHDQLFSNINVLGTGVVQNILISNAYITNIYSSNIVTTNLYAVNTYTTNLYESNAYITNLTFDISHGGKLTVTNVDVTYVNAVTNFYFYSTNLFVDNTYVSNYFATNVFNNSYVSNFLFTNVFVTNQYVTNLYSTNVVNVNNNVSNFWQTNIFVNDTTVSNYFATNIFNEFITNIFNSFDTTIITNLYVTTNLTVQNTYTTNLFTENINITTNFFFSSTNLYVNNSYVSNYFTTNVFNDTFVSNYLITNLYTTNVYTTNLYSTNVVNNNSYVSNFWQTNIFVTDTTVSNYFATNIFITTNVVIQNINLTNATLYGGTTLKDSGTNFTLQVYSSLPGVVLPNIFSSSVDSNDSAKIALNVQLQPGDPTKPFLGTFGSAAIRGFSPVDNHDSNTLYSAHASVGVVGVIGNAFTTGAGEGIGTVGYGVGVYNINYGLLGVIQRLQRTDATNIGVAGTVMMNGNTAGTYVGGYFEITTNKAGYAATDAQNPNYGSGALIADNRNSGKPIFVAKQQGSSKLEVDPSGGVFVSDAIRLGTNSFVGPTNTLNAALMDQYYTTSTALSITNITGVNGTNSQSVQLSILNTSGGDVAMTLPASVVLSAGSNMTITNNTEKIFWFKIRPGRTNCIAQTF